jgi:hypothetical protein
MSRAQRAKGLAALAGVVAVGLALGGASGTRLAAGHGLRGGASAPRGAPSTPAQAPTESARELLVPRASAELQIDGELDEAAWQEPGGRTGPFSKDGVIARPYSDARLLWRGDTLYLALYAADEDILAPLTQHDAPLWTGDAFHLVFRRGDKERSIDVSPRGTVSDGERLRGGAFDARWESRARVGVDRDGTMDDPRDEDEEWIVEMAIPLEALGLEGRSGERIGLEIRRCDRIRSSVDAHESTRTCAAWGDARSELVLQ